MFQANEVVLVDINMSVSARFSVSINTDDYGRQLIPFLWVCFFFDFRPPNNVATSINLLFNLLWWKHQSSAVLLDYLQDNYISLSSTR